MTKTMRGEAARSDHRIATDEALRVLIELRAATDVAVTHQGSAREWPKLSQHQLDFHYLPSAMGAAIPLAVGLAMAQPDRQILVVTGEGSLLMNLGSLVTLIGSGARNVSVVVLDNGVYAVTGCQQTPASDLELDFAALARALGFHAVASYQDLDQWQSGASEFFCQPGPRLVCLRVEPQVHRPPPGGLAPIAQRILALKNALATKQV